MSLEGVELRHLKREEPIPNTLCAQIVTVLQYRTKVKEACRVEYRRGGNIFTRDGFRDVWTDWQDVPVVEES